jgi:hypothetical protein
MSKRATIIGVLLLFSIGVASAQTPSPDAVSAARKLVDTLKLSDKFKAQLPAILLNIKPAVVQGRPEIERDYDAMTSSIADAYTPHFNAMVDAAATIYASNLPWTSCAKSRRSIVDLPGKSFCRSRQQSPS